MVQTDVVDMVGRKEDHSLGQSKRGKREHCRTHNSRFDRYHDSRQRNVVVLTQIRHGRHGPIHGTR